MKERDANVEEALIRDILADKDTPLVRRTLEVNRVIKHNFKVQQQRVVECMLEDCTKQFEITLLPNQILYPKYCEKHRSEYQRTLWQEKNNT